MNNDFVRAKVEALKTWSHVLVWASVLLPLLGAAAGIARFYVDRKEKSLSTALAREEMNSTKNELEALRRRTNPRELSEDQQAAIHSVLEESLSSTLFVISRMMDSESAQYAKHLESEFAKHGWIVVRKGSSLNEFRGVAVTYVGESERAAAEVVTKAIKAADIPLWTEAIRPNSIAGVDGEGVIVVIGER